MLSGGETRRRRHKVSVGVHDLEDVGKKWGTPAHPRNVVSDRRREWKHLDNILAGEVRRLCGGVGVRFR